MRTYYIVFEHANERKYPDRIERNNIQSYRIRNTNHNMDTSNGLQSILKELDKETGNQVVITYWRELNV